MGAITDPHVIGSGTNGNGPGIPLVRDPNAVAADAIARAATGALIGPPDIMAIWRISRPTYHRLNRTGHFDQFKVHPAIGTKCFSGKLITQYLAGVPVYPESARARRRRG